MEPIDRGVDARSDEALRLAALWRSGWTELPRQQADDAVRLAAMVTGTQAAAAVVVDDERQLSLAQCGELPRSLPRTLSLALPLLASAADHDVLDVPDARLDSRWSRHPVLGDTAAFRACLAVPLRLPEGWVAGALMVLDPLPRTFTAAQRDGLGSVARLLAASFNAQRLARLLDRIGPAVALSEGSGALPSEAVLAQRLAQEWQRHARKGESLGMICLTSPPGLDALTVTEAVASSLRSSDFLAVLDDGRLAALLPTTGVNAAMHVAQRIRQALERKQVADDVRGVHIGLAAMIPNRSGQPVQLLQRARHALQRAEQAALGRIETFAGW